MNSNNVRQVQVKVLNWLSVKHLTSFQSCRQLEEYALMLGSVCPVIKRLNLISSVWFIIFTWLIHRLAKQNFAFFLAQFVLIVILQAWEKVNYYHNTVGSFSLTLQLLYRTFQTSRPQSWIWISSNYRLLTFTVSHIAREGFFPQQGTCQISVELFRKDTQKLFYESKRNSVKWYLKKVGMGRLWFCSL